jgi:23S rRNA (adenine2030-N6)-methyltransferase
LRGTGLLAINPPWTLEAEMKIVLPALARLFAPSGKGEVILEPLVAPGH